jgi:DNA-binding NtrC family response regulator
MKDRLDTEACLIDRARLIGLGASSLADIIVEAGERDPAVRSLLQRAIETMAPGHDGEQRASADPASAEPHMVGTSAPIRKVFDLIRKYANTDAPVLITGESGTGKELAAIALHERSPYRNGPFVPINCAGLPASLIGAELFGHEKGAFTGAHQRKIGRIESAVGGTVFLDEIGDLPIELQPHLLRFLQEKTVDRLGGNRPIRVDVRVVAATNADLHTAMSEGRFRRALYYPLKVLSIDIPQLRERTEDILLISRFFIRKFSQDMGVEPPALSSGAIDALQSYGWPGNIRELISSVRRAIVMASGTEIEAEHLGIACDGWQEPAEDTVPPPARRANPSDSAETTWKRIEGLKYARRATEGSLIRDTLERHNHNVTRAAAALGISRVTVYRLMKKYQIERFR